MAAMRSETSEISMSGSPRMDWQSCSRRLRTRCLPDTSATALVLRCGGRRCRSRATSRKGTRFERIRKLRRSRANRARVSQAETRDAQFEIADSTASADRQATRRWSLRELKRARTNCCTALQRALAMRAHGLSQRLIGTVAVVRPGSFDPQSA